MPLLQDPDSDGFVSQEEFFKLFTKVNKSSRRRASVTDADLNKALQNSKVGRPVLYGWRKLNFNSAAILSTAAAFCIPRRRSGLPAACKRAY